MTADLERALSTRCYVTSERHLSGARVVIGFATRAEAAEAHAAIAASGLDPAATDGLRQADERSEEPNPSSAGKPQTPEREEP